MMKAYSAVFPSLRIGGCGGFFDDVADLLSRENMRLFQIVVVLVFSGVFGCSDEKRQSTDMASEQIKLDPVLKDIDPQIALLEVMLGVNSVVNCSLAQAMAGLSRAEGKVPVQRDIRSEVLASITNEQEGLCKVYNRAHEESKATFDEIRRVNRLLDRQYFFSVILDKADENENFKEEQIGVFASLESCQRVEELAREYRIPTRVCAQWQGLKGSSN